MIYINVRGRAGNQMFVYALAKAIVEQTGQRVRLCFSMQLKENPNFVNDLILFKYDARIQFDYETVFPYYANNSFWPTKIARKIAPKKFFKLMQKIGVYLWLGEEYMPINICKNGDIYLDGFWQSEKYFKPYRDKIIQDFSPQKLDKEKTMEFVTAAINSQSVCVSIRRGDYVSNQKNEKMYYLCDEHYFAKAISIMNSKLEKAKWFVFSDDIEWARNTISFPGEVFYESGDDDIATKLYMMSSCKHFIISNSSFSWWAQELSNNKEKIVIAPNRWYKDNRLCDIYNDNWLKLEV